METITNTQTAKTQMLRERRTVGGDELSVYFARSNRWKLWHVVKVAGAENWRESLSADSLQH